MGAPVFAWRDAVARDAHTGAALNGMATVSRVAGARRRQRRRRRRGPARRRAARELARGLRRRAIVAGFPLAVAALNRAGLGPLRADISGDELRRAGLAAMGEVAARLGLGDAHVVFGHTHRAGPLRGDERARVARAAAARGSSTAAAGPTPTSSSARRGPSNPYWPGSGRARSRTMAPPRLAAAARGPQPAQQLGAAAPRRSAVAVGERFEHQARAR